VIRPAVVGHALGIFLFGLAGLMLIPLAVALPNAGDDPRPMLYGFLVTAAAGWALYLVPQPAQTDLSLREGFLLAVSVWVSAFTFGALPFWFSPYFPSFTDAYFEATSGFTTTGATVLDNMEVLSPSIQLWRLGSHWVGGMGILLLGIAILPLLGAGGMHLYRAEFSGSRSDKLKPRIAETALALWRIYVGLTLACYVALRLAGMGPFDALCHSFSSVGTGGFSTRTASIAAYGSAAIEYVVVVFMLLGGINFTRQYRLWVERQPRGFFRDPEVRAYLFLVAAATAVLAGWLASGGYGPGRAFRAALFQVSSVMTTTGYATEDYATWGPFPQLVLLGLMFVGGSTGSTSGGMKVARIVMLFKIAGRNLARLVQRRAVLPVRLGGQSLPENAIQAVLNFFYLAFLINFFAALLLAATGLDLVTSISAAAASMFNVGPGFGSVGPVEHYGHIPTFAKWVVIACMLAGRLEYFTALVIFTPAFWRK
jgi:trk system potassium uptake protein